MWHNADDEETCATLLKEKKIINKYPNINRLVWKDTFQRIMETGRELCPETFNFVPESYNLPQDGARLKKEFKKGETYICKP